MNEYNNSHCMCESCKDGNLHDSDCAVHNMPAYENSDCDCKLKLNKIKEEQNGKFQN